MEDKWIKAVKNWPEPTLVRDIQVIIDFANFYWHFIQGFSRIATLLISLLKATELLDSASKTFKADEDEVVGVNALLTSPLKATGLSGLDPKAFNADDDEVVKVDDKANKTVVNSSIQSKNEKSKKLTHMPNIGAIGKPNFLTPDAKESL